MQLARFGLFTCLVAALQAAELSCIVTNAKTSEPLADAVVSLIPFDAEVPPVAADAQIEIAQEDQEFAPFVTVVQAGTHVVFPNRDTVQHHAYSLSKPRKFELPLYNPGQKESVVFEVPGLVTIGCNIHDWMIAHLVVVPTPWFAKTGSPGTVKLAAPPGRYRLEVWHPRLAKVELRELTLAEGLPATETFGLTLKADRRVRRSPGGKTGGYR
jgi:plastocyanin